jgi:hypothetical protein
MSLVESNAQSAVSGGDGSGNFLLFRFSKKRLEDKR